VIPILALASLLALSPATGQTIDGVRCERMEATAFHIHAHLAIFDRGKPLPIPEDVGRPIVAQCFYWLHTHTPDGIIHVESPVARTFTLGQFLDIWDERLPARRGEPVTVWVNGAKYKGNYRSIPLAQHTDITIDVGMPAPVPKPFVDWNGN
jgi:hypothetical protein